MKLSDEQWGEIVGEVVGVTRRELREEWMGHVGRLEERIADLEQHIREFKYVGVWREGRSYKLGNGCTDRGARWDCLRDTTARPGINGDWQMSVKSAVNGHDPDPPPRRVPTRHGGQRP